MLYSAVEDLMMSIKYISPLPSELAAIIAAVSIVILTCNLLVMLTFCRMRKLSIQQLYMVALVGPDLTMFIVNSISCGITINGGVSLDRYQCQLLGVITHSSYGATALIHTAMCVDRWFLVFSPIKYRIFKFRKNTRVIVCLIITLCYLLPVMLNFVLLCFDSIDLYFEPFLPSCIMTVNRDYIVGCSIQALLFILIPFVIEGTTNVHILVKVIKLRGTNRSRIGKSVRVVSITVMSFYICWLPASVYALWVIFELKPPVWWFLFLANQMIAANSAMSFPIYFFTNPSFRAQFLSFNR